MFTLPSLVVCCAFAASASAQSELTSSARLDAGPSTLQNSRFGGDLETELDWLVVGADQSTPGLEGEVQLHFRVGGTVFDLQDTVTGDFQGDGFGTAVGLAVVSGVPTVIVGAPSNSQQLPGAGRAYVYDYVGGSLQLWGALEPTNPVINSAFGSAVATTGDTLLVGRPFSDTGIVYPFDRSSGSLVQFPPAAPFDGAAGDAFGSALDMSGLVLAVGAPFHDQGTGNEGAVYLFEQSAPGLPFSPLFPLTNAKVVASDLRSGANFGASVSLDGDLLVVGAPLAPDGGAAYVFRRDGAGVFVEESILTVSGAGSGARLGSDVSVRDGRIVVGAEQANSAVGSTGAAYVFEEGTPGAGDWVAVWKLIGTGASSGSFVGGAVAQLPELPLVGSPRADVVDPEDGQLKVDAGAVFVFDLSTGLCLVDQIAQPAQGRADRFGASLAFDGATLAVGSPLDDDLGSDTGSVSVFERTLEGLLFDSLLTPTAASSGAAFGRSVALEGNRLLVSAPGQGGFSGSAGSVELFTRIASTEPFLPDRTLLPEVTAGGDGFGSGVAIDQGVALVGRTGLPGAIDGAALTYDLTRPGSTPNQVLTGLAGNTQSGTGATVAAGGGSALVGAPSDSSQALNSGSVLVLSRQESIPVDVKVVSGDDPAIAAAVSGFGRSLTSMPDMDGNGIDEIVVGAPSDPEGGAGTGAVWILFPAADGSILSAKKLSAGQNLPGIKPTAGDGFGTSVTAGRFNNDEIIDLYVGAPFDDKSGTNHGSIFKICFDSKGDYLGGSISSFAGGPGIGDSVQYGATVVGLGNQGVNSVDAIAAIEGGGARRVTIAFNSMTIGEDTADSFGAVFSPAILTSGLGVVLDDFGVSAAYLGDLDGDGSYTIAIGDPDADFGDGPRGGIVLADFAQDETFAGASAIGPGVGGFGSLPIQSDFGSSLSCPGDLDGDGVNDLLVGDPNSDPGNIAGAGRLYSLLLNPDGSVKEWYFYDYRTDGLAYPLDASVLGEEFGTAVATVGDLDGNGSIDWVVGTDSERVRILFTGPGFHVVGKLEPATPVAGERFGGALAAEGRTLSVGAPGEGASPGRVEIYDRSGAEVTHEQTLTPADPVTGERFGTSVELAGNRLVVGAAGADGVSAMEGRAYVFERAAVGAPFFETEVVELATLLAPSFAQPGAGFGESLALVGGDLVVGSPNWDGGGIDQGAAYLVSLSGGGCTPEFGTADYLSVATGGPQQLAVQPGPEFASQPYLTLAALDAGPPLPIVGMPLAFDAFLQLSLAQPNSPSFVDTFGILDADGKAQSQIVLPAGLPPSLVGTKIYAAYAVLDLFPLSALFASDAIVVELVP